jgi:hypothetical protein
VFSVARQNTTAKGCAKDVTASSLFLVDGARSLIFAFDVEPPKLLTSLMDFAESVIVGWIPMFFVLAGAASLFLKSGI